MTNDENRRKAAECRNHRVPSFGFRVSGCDANSSKGANWRNSCTEERLARTLAPPRRPASWNSKLKDARTISKPEMASDSPEPLWRIRALPPADSLSPAPSGGEGRGEGVLVFTECSYLSRRALLSPALSSLRGRRGSPADGDPGRGRIRPSLLTFYVLRPASAHGRLAPTRR